MRLILKVEYDEAAPQLEELRGALADRLGINRAIAARILVPVQLNFREMAMTNHNRFGARSSFWNLMLSGTYADANEQEAIVGMPAPVALRYFGGTVHPVQAHALAIPNRIEAYGKSPRDFPNLQVIPFKRSDGSQILALVENLSQLVKILKSGRVRRGPVIGFADKADAQGRATEDDVFFWLVPVATIAGNPAVLPTDEAILDAARGGFDSYISRFLRGRLQEGS
jgi:hypothetical protein